MFEEKVERSRETKALSNGECVERLELQTAINAFYRGTRDREGSGGISRNHRTKTNIRSTSLGAKTSVMRYKGKDCFV